MYVEQPEMTFAKLWSVSLLYEYQVCENILNTMYDVKSWMNEIIFLLVGGGNEFFEDKQ